MTTTIGGPMEPQPVQSAAGAADAKVRVSFVTKHDQYRIPETGMLLPANLRRYGLSEVVNHILGRETPVPFDFLIDGQFLRTSIVEYLTANATSLETTIVLEYVPSAKPPSEIGSFPHPDWVSAVAGNGQSQLILTACYDGNARVWNKSRECVATLEASSLPLKAARWWTSKESKLDRHCLTAGADQSIQGWTITEKWQSSVAFRCVGHTSSVDALDVSPDSRYFASGSFDGTARLWTTSLDHSTEPEEPEDGAGRPSKKRKGERSSSIPIKNSIRTFEGHSGAVGAVCFDMGSESKALITGGADHSIRFWDLETGFATRTLTTDRVVTSVDVSRLAGLIVSAHTDRVIRLWDSRASEGSTVKLKFAGHQAWVSAVKWSPTNPYVFTSGSYDGTVKIWDIRSETALFSAAAAGTDEKVLAIDWVDNLIFAGGSDSLLRALEFQG